jgi:hypothetical protein
MNLINKRTFGQVILCCSVLVLLTLGTMKTASAQDPTAASSEFEPINWAYSSVFGTGWYQVEDARSVFVLRVPLRTTLRKSSISETGERKLGIGIKYPLTVGLHDVEDLGGIIENDNFGTVSFVPGVVLEFPINKRWYLRSFAHIGWGKELQAGEAAWMYYAGIKSRYKLPVEKYDLFLLNGFYYAGFTPDIGRSDHLATASMGFELRQPLSNATLMGRPIDLHWNVMYSFLGRELHFNLPDGRFDPINETIELGLQMSFRDGPFKLWFINVQRLGVGYRVSPDGQFTAITLSMRSWFTN